MNPRPIAIFYACLLLLSPLTAALPTNTTTVGNALPEMGVNPASPSQGSEDTYTVLSFQAATSSTSAACSISTLSDSEVQRLKDTVLTPGLSGNEISAGTAPNANREKVSDSNKLLVPNPDSKETAFQKDIPTEVLQPDELSPLQNQNVRGPFAFGLSIDDSLRAARCVDDASCMVLGEKLQLRNSGSGIVGNVKDIYHAVTADLDKPTPSFTPEEADYLRGQIESDQLLKTPDANHVYVQSYSRTPSASVMNHIRADNTIQAGVLTNCDKGTCILSLYSMFDKYFNSWYSGEMVVSTFGPTLWGQFKKMLTRGKRGSLITGTLADKLDFVRTRNLGRMDSTLVEGAEKGAPVAPSEIFGTNWRPGGTIEGKTVLDNAKKTLQKETSGFNAYFDLFGDKKAVSAGKGAGYIDNAFGDGGVLTKITDADDRRKIFAYTGQIKEYADAVNRTREFYLDGANAVIKSDRVMAARGMGKIAFDLDDVLKLDFVEVVRQENGMDLAGLAVKPVSGGVLGDAKDLLTSDSKYFRDNILETFVNKGEFSSLNGVLELGVDPVTKKQGVILYKLVPSKPVGPATAEALDKGLYEGLNIRLTSGLTIPASKDYAEVIKADIKAHPDIGPQVVTAEWQPAGKILTPENLADRMLAGDAKGGVLGGKIKNYWRNTNNLYDEMVARDWGKGKYTNILSKQLQSQEKLISNYFNLANPNVLQSGIGWTAKMYGYWWLTRGFGSDKYSIYQLPKEWTEVQFEPGTSSLYDDAYVDFLSNEGSDTGDIFQSVISKFPVPLVLSEFAKTNPTLQTAWDYLNAQQGRSQPDNLAVFLSGAQSCPTCSASIASPTSARFDVQYLSPESVNSFFIEHAKTSEAKTKGQYLLTFAHHTDIKGQMKGEGMDSINLVQARQDNETCEQVSNNLFIYGSVSKLLGAEKTGAILAGTESLSYWAGGMMGIFVTAANQLAIAPQMQDCVDDKEGYFASLFVPKASENPSSAAKSDALEKSVSTNAIDGIREFAQRIDANHTNPSLTDKALHEATSKVTELVDEAQQNNVAEAELRVTGSSSGNFRSHEVIYFWAGGGARITPTQYSEVGKTVVATQDGHTITLDNAAGTVSVDGQVVVDPEHADHTRLATKDLAIPAVEIPQRLNTFALGADANSLLFNVNVRGETLVQDPDLLNCIQSAVLDQSGVPLNSNNMSEAFGSAQSVVTDAYPNIAIDPTKNRILLGGQLPQSATGPAAGISVFGSRRVVVTGAPNPEAGHFQSILLENGSVLYKPQTNELIIWLRHHAGAVVNASDVKNFTGTLTNTTNPTTSCEEPAVNLKVETDPATPATKLKGDNLSAGLQKNGPFQVFDTDTKRFILYSKLVDGQCKPYFRVINKLTGEIYDQPIEDITQAEDGTISIKTADGQTHSLSFSDQNGKPVITYDGNSELLRSASGKGGSFYYDPNTGNYVAENAQLIPLNDNFKNQGVAFQANPDGTVSGKPGSNVFVINPTQGSQGLFNIPSLPEDAAGILLVVLLLGIVCAGIYLDVRKKKDLSV